MKRISQLPILLLILVISSCGAEPSENQDSIIVPDEPTHVDTIFHVMDELIPEEAEIADFDVKIDSFVEFPQEIDGCACYFSKTFDEFNMGNYIYMDDFGNEIAFMKLDGKMTSFIVNNSSWEDSGAGIIEVSNATYAIELNFKQVSKLDETFQKEGELVITNDAGETISIPFFGECGC